MPPRATSRLLALATALGLLVGACAARGESPPQPSNAGGSERSAQPSNIGGSLASGGATSAGAVSAATGTAGVPRPLTKLIMGQTGPSPASWPMYVALAHGLYAAEGLELETVVLSASSTQTQALIAGDLHVNTYSVDSMAKAVLAGTPLKLVGSAQNIPNFQLIVAPDVRSFADLRGKLLGAGSPGGYFDIVLRGMLSAHGLDASEYQMFSIANPRARVPAIKAGQVAGALIGGPDDSLALAEGFNSLGYVHETIPDLDYSGYAVEDGWARAHESLVVGFLRGTLQAIAWLRDPANGEDAKRLYGEVTELPPEFLDKLYEQMVVQQMLSLTMRPNLKGIENVLTLSVQQGSMASVPPVDSWVDARYLDAASR